MSLRLPPPGSFSRRRFLRQSFAFSALAGLGSFSSLAEFAPSDPTAAELLVLGDWGYDDQTAQSQVAAGLSAYAKQHSVHPEALLMLGDNWYGELAGGAHSPRWQTQFEQMYPAKDFPCPAYAVLGNHDYQLWPESKVDAELEYARSGRNGAAATRWTMPARWYRFEFPAKNPLVTFLALDSNMPRPDGKEKGGRDFTLTAQQQAEQLAWLEGELKRPRTTPFVAVIAHHPVFSDGPHGDHPVLIRDWIRCSANTASTSLWPATIMICSTWSLMGIPPAIFFPGAVVRTCTRLKLSLHNAAPMRRRFMVSAISRSQPGK
jgi:tartrate-resistant acid phosphatase type 5